MSMPNVPVETAGAATDTLTGRPRPTGIAGPTDAEQLIFTLRAGTGELVKAEKVDATGKRTLLTTDEAVELAEHDLQEIESALDEAFETGVMSMLQPGGDADASDAVAETPEDRDIRRQLLTLIVGEEPRERLRRSLAARLYLLGKLESRRSKLADA